MSRLRSVALVCALVLAAPLATAVRPVAPASAVDCPTAMAGVEGCPPVSGSVLGYILITHVASMNSPLGYQLLGALAAPNEWTCSDSTSASGAYKVTCVPAPSSFYTWRCDILHADARTTNPSGRVRTSMDCDGAAPAEAQTAVVSGTAGGDAELATSALGLNVTEFSCTVDGGGTLPRSPDFTAGCGDPGLVKAG